jgi:hypothetical protein
MKVVQTLRVGRTILVVLLAVAVSLLPASMGIASAAPGSGDVVAAATQAMPDCEHHKHQVPLKQTQKSADHGACVVSCALCFGFVGATGTATTYVLSPIAVLELKHATDDVSSLMGSPPFRPPRA